MPITPDCYESLVRGFMPARVLLTGVELGLFDIIEHGTGTIEEIAATAGVNIRGVTMLLDALVAMDLLTKKDWRYFNTDLAR